MIKETCGGMCDNCKNPKELIEAKTETQQALKVIKSFK